jgi:hypothetical protein
LSGQNIIKTTTDFDFITWLVIKDNSGSKEQ